MNEKSNASEGSSSSGEGGRANEGKGELAQEVKELASEAAGQVRTLAESRLSPGRSRAADALAGVAKTLREAGGKVEAPPGLDVERYTSRAAGGIDRLSGYVRERDLRGMVSDVESFARREPALFFGGAFALGLVGSRFLKSSTPPRSTSAVGAARRAPSFAEEGEPRGHEQGPQPARPAAEPKPQGAGLETSRAGERGGRPVAGAPAAGGEGKKAPTRTSPESPSVSSPPAVVSNGPPSTHPGRAHGKV